jgi:hypothetical protein
MTFRVIIFFKGHVIPRERIVRAKSAKEAVYIVRSENGDIESITAKKIGK